MCAVFISLGIAVAKICKKCHYWIEEVSPEIWIDYFDDDACYDEELNMQGHHEPEE